MRESGGRVSGLKQMRLDPGLDPGSRKQPAALPPGANRIGSIWLDTTLGFYLVGDVCAIRSDFCVIAKPPFLTP